MNFLKGIVRSLLGSLGYEIRRTANKLPADVFEWQRRLTRTSSPVIFDVGAYTGEVASVYRTIFADARIFCFEPNPSSFAQLQAKMHADERVRMMQAAVTAHGEHVVLNSNSAPATSSVLRTDTRADKHWGHGLLDTREEIRVASVTLDQFCRDEGLSHIDILKIDVQGSELSVLRGARSLLSRGGINLIYLELILCPTYESQPRLAEYLELMDEAGYVLCNYFDPVVKRHRLLQMDALFMSPQLSSSAIDD